MSPAITTVTGLFPPALAWSLDIPNMTVVLASESSAWGGPMARAIIGGMLLSVVGVAFNPALLLAVTAFLLINSSVLWRFGEGNRVCHNDAEAGYGALDTSMIDGEIEIHRRVLGQESRRDEA